MSGKIRNPDDAAYEVEHIVRKIHDLLRGRTPEVQGGILADLVSLWVAGHSPWARDQILAEWIKLLRDLIPESDKQLFGEAGHPDKRRPRR